MNKIEWIIALLYAKNNEKIYGITRMEKLLFFYLKLKENIGDLNNFKYEAYDYGPHSDDIRDLLYTLREKGVINIETKNTYDFLEIDDIKYEDDIKPINYDKEEIYSLTKVGEDIGAEIRKKMKEDFDYLSDFKRKFNNIKLKRLIQIIYTKYPEMTIKSKIIKNIFG